MIPKYEEIMLPFLKFLSDGKEHSLSEAHDLLAKEFKLTDEEEKELLSILKTSKPAFFKSL
ncbi:MAG: winged helix-turn-helix domain-containing protein [Planctomycetota bacterium]|jgi:restriction system protein